LTTKKTIYIIRHGETDFNRKGIIQGSGINSDLNKKGRHQATLFHMAYGHVPFEHIYTSSLIRTRQSVAPFIQSGISHESLSELDEINWGVFEGVKANPIFKAKYHYIVSRWRNGHLDEPIEGGESPLNMYSRQQQGLSKILDQSTKSTILICMHGRAMRSFLSLLLQTPLKDMDDYPHSNLCLYVVEMLGNLGKLKVLNNTEHLQ
jgi:2,3-bisphosphoglycerate-dependent phosphoglycerate mutase